MAPKYGKTSMLVYITICSLIGGLSVACTSGLGSSILTSIRGDNQVKNWFFWFLAGFVVITLLTEINYLNKVRGGVFWRHLRGCAGVECSLASHHRLSRSTTRLWSRLRTTSSSLEPLSSRVLSSTRASKLRQVGIVSGIAFGAELTAVRARAVDIVTVVMGFITICCGITLLQLSKVEPNDVATKGLDRRSTMLLSASRARAYQDGDYEKGLDAEDPGIDALRGSFGAIGSIHRAMSARRRSTMNGRESAFDPSTLGRTGAPGAMGSGPTESGMGMSVLRGVQLYDAPMPCVSLVASSPPRAS